MSHSENLRGSKFKGTVAVSTQCTSVTNGGIGRQIYRRTARMAVAYTDGALASLGRNTNGYLYAGNTSSFARGSATGVCFL